LLAEFPSLTTIVIISRSGVRRWRSGRGRSLSRNGDDHGEDRDADVQDFRQFLFPDQHRAAERLYDTALGFAHIRADDVVYDLYSGTGTIALHIAAGAGNVIGIESVEQAVEDARRTRNSTGFTIASSSMVT